MGGSRLAGQQPIWEHCCQVLNPSTPPPSSWPGGPGPGLITPGGLLSPKMDPDDPAQEMGTCP